MGWDEINLNYIKLGEEIHNASNFLEKQRKISFFAIVTIITSKIQSVKIYGHYAQAFSCRSNTPDLILGTNQPQLN